MKTEHHHIPFSPIEVFNSLLDARVAGVSCRTVWWERGWHAYGNTIYELKYGAIDSEIVLANQTSIEVCKPSNHACLPRIYLQINSAGHFQLHTLIQFGDEAVLKQ